MLPTVDQLRRIAGINKASVENMESVIAGLRVKGPLVGLDVPHRLAQYLAQLAHESGRFVYDREVWGPTPAQQRYDTRVDLGNTPQRDGDGEKYKGRTGGQITGRDNYRAFRDWCREIGLSPPDFIVSPELINTDPWEGLGPIWFWSTRKLNALADENNIEQITKKWNGGLNGFPDRLDLYTRAGLVLLGHVPTDITLFQRWAQQNGYLPADEKGKPSQIDGDAGPKTRAAIHKALVALSNVSVQRDTAAAPVVEEVEVEIEKPVPVEPKGGRNRLGTWFNGLFAFAGANAATFLTTDFWTKVLIIAVIAVSIGFLIWRGDLIARRIKAIVAEFGDSDG